MADLFRPTLDYQIATVEREIRVRRSVYPRQVAARRMGQDYADREIAAMEAVRDTLVKLKEG